MDTKKSCSGGETAVLLVHGIGVQPKNDTLETYGGSIERVWNEFGSRRANYTSTRCSDGHIHLHGGQRTIMIDECHWDPVVSEPPRPRSVLRWLLVTAPLMASLSLIRAPRWQGGLWARYNALTAWASRTALAMFSWFAFGFVLPLIWLLGHVLRMSKLQDKALRTMMLTVGDAYRFVNDPVASQAMVDRAARDANVLATHSEKLVVVAHSQGGAITWRALQSPLWPRHLPTSVVTLGSGHKRLLLLRDMYRNRTRLWLTCIGLLVSLVGIVALSDYSTATQNGEPDNTSAVLGMGIVWAVAAALILRSWTKPLALKVNEVISTHTQHRWVDIWATRDLVPDGPLRGVENPSLRVQNRHSAILDHTTYHLNPAGVIAPIVNMIDESRLTGEHERILALCEARRRRLRSWLRFLGLAPFHHPYRPGCVNTLNSEFQGLVPQGSRATPGRSDTELPPPPPKGSASALVGVGAVVEF